MENNIEGPVSPVQVDAKRGKYPGPLAAGIIFSLATIFLTYGGVILKFENKYLRSGVGEVLFILLPVLIFLIVGKYDIKGTLKLRRTKPVNYMIIVFLMISGMPVVGVCNALVMGAIRLIFGKNLPVDQIDISDLPTLLAAILVIGVAAAVCEEVLFRGMISKGYERFGVAGSIIFTSALFGILHRDIQKTVSTVLLGALIGFIVYKTKSIYAGMVAHFTNNTVVVFITYGTSAMREEFEKMGINQSQSFDFSSIPTPSLVFVIIFYSLFFLAFVAVFTALFYAFCRCNKNTGEIARLEAGRIDAEGEYAGEQITGSKVRTGKFSLAALIGVLPGIILVFLIFVGQVLNLMDINSGIIYNVLKAMWLVK